MKIGTEWAILFMGVHEITSCTYHPSMWYF